MYPNYPMMTGQYVPMRKQRNPGFTDGPIRPQNGLGSLGQGGYAPPEQAPQPVGAYAPPEGPPMQQPGSPFGGFRPNEPGAYPQPNQNTGPLPPNFNPKPMGNWGFNDGSHMPPRQPNFMHPGWLRLQQMFGNGGGWG